VSARGRPIWRVASSSGDEDLEQLLLEDLADETLVNNQALARKDPLFISALALLVLAIVVELTGKL
jgi:hypothetical protein